METRRGMRIHALRTPRHRRDEAIAASADCLDAASARVLFIEDRAERRDLNEEITLRDSHLRPDGGHDLFLRNGVASPFNQQGEKVERPRPDRDRRGGAMIV